MITILGVSLSFIAWVGILFALLAPSRFYELIGASGPALGQHYLLAVAQSALVTGLALMLVGVLRVRICAKDIAPSDALDRHALTNKKRDVANSEAPVAEPIILETGILRGSTYKLYSDSTIELDTSCGRRKFDSIQSAIAFLGPNANLLSRAA